MPPLFPKTSSEVAYVRLQALLCRRFQELVQSKELIETSTLELSPGQSSQVIVVMSPGGSLKDSYQVICLRSVVILIWLA